MGLLTVASTLTIPADERYEIEPGKNGSRWGDVYDKDHNRVGETYTWSNGDTEITIDRDHDHELDPK